MAVALTTLIRQTLSQAPCHGCTIRVVILVKDASATWPKHTRIRLSCCALPHGSEFHLGTINLIGRQTPAFLVQMLMMHLRAHQEMLTDG